MDSSLAAPSVGGVVADPGGGAEVQARRTVEAHGARVVANVEHVAVLVVRQERRRAVGVDRRAFSFRRARLERRIRGRHRRAGGQRGESEDERGGGGEGELHFGWGGRFFWEGSAGGRCV